MTTQDQGLAVYKAEVGSKTANIFKDGLAVGTKEKAIFQAVRKAVVSLIDPLEFKKGDDKGRAQVWNAAWKKFVLESCDEAKITRPEMTRKELEPLFQGWHGAVSLVRINHSLIPSRLKDGTIRSLEQLLAATSASLQVPNPTSSDTTTQLLNRFKKLKEFAKDNKEELVLYSVCKKFLDQYAPTEDDDADDAGE